MKILIPVGDVPIGSKITKKTGEKIYEVRDRIIIYSEKECPKPINELNASEGTRFLLSTDSQYSFAIVAVPETLEVLWELSNDRLRQYLYDIESHQ